MMRSASKELASSTPIVNARGAAAATPMTEAIRVNERYEDKHLESIPLGRWADPDEIAGVYVFLTSPHCDYMTRQTLPVHDGRVPVH